MCTADGPAPASVAEALRMANASMDYLNSRAADEVDAAGSGEVLTSLGEIQSKFTAAHATVLSRFDAGDAHNADGYGTSARWLEAMARMTVRDAKAAMRQMRALGKHPCLEEALAAGEISASWAAQILKWVSKLPARLRHDDEAIAGIVEILVRAAASGASLEDLQAILVRAEALWRAGHPDADDDRFGDRYVQVGSTVDGAGTIRGDLTPECTAAVQAVLDALGKRAGPEDNRSEGQRFHDALQLGCELLIRAKMVPDRAGADTHVAVHIPFAWMAALDEAAPVIERWLTDGLGRPGSLTGKDAEAAACDALAYPVVTGHADMTVIDKIIDFVLGAYSHRDGQEDDSDPDDSTGDGGHGPGQNRAARGGRLAARNRGRARIRAAQLTPEAEQALQYAIGRLAIDFVSGPSGIAGWLRTTLLAPPYDSPSLPLDIGYSDTIPGHIRRAVQLRDKHCAWPRCGRPAAWCDVHHLKHKADGGETAAADCVLLCQFHHDICIHRWGWQLILHPDGTTTARGPHGQIIHSHSPPTTQAA